MQGGEVIRKAIIDKGLRSIEKEKCNSKRSWHLRSIEKEKT